MKSPAELDAVPWKSLRHAYGPAEDVPELIRALYQDDETAAAEAMHELYGNIHHQGTVYPASAPAVPFLVHAARHIPGRRVLLLMLLATLADHDRSDSESPHWQHSSVAEVCAELCRVLPELLPCLTDPERPVRRAALRVAGAVAELLPAGLRARVEEEVAGLYDADPVPAVRADALVVLNRLGREATSLDSPYSEVRLAAATLAAERSGPPYPAALVEVFGADGAEPDPGDDDFPWSGTDTPDSHLTRLLAEDPDAALAVAARWIEAGDLGSRGSRLAQETVEMWPEPRTR
ncbi:HEAT repeat domain-containing protein [Streptomyces sp. NPDC059402]|uniref:HEAT repeat domain-containing protein n=1 Tax=Streptomyces sp. NPDC059402 TaxID=3346822 RepID=UPI00369F7DB4